MIAAILQLCLVFSILCWSLSLPFMGERFALKSDLSVYEYVLDNTSRFAELPAEERQKIQDEYYLLQNQPPSSFWSNCLRALHIVAFELPALERAWLFFSLVISIFLLLRIEGATQVAWLIPLIVCAYAVDNRKNGVPSTLTEEALLFPSEEVIIRDYLREPLEKDIFKQQQQLTQGWHSYLIRQWAQEMPSGDPFIFSRQLEKGEYAFHTARLKKIGARQLKGTRLHFNRQESMPILGLYMVWNIGFAYLAGKKKRREASAASG